MQDQTPADMDGGWKQIIDDELEEFFRFFFPQVHAAIDFRYGCQSRDKELAKIMVGADVGDREADKLFEVQWRDGGQELVLVHVEVQAQGERDFAQRMYVYNTRIWQRYGRPAVSLALLVDEDPQFRPDQFVREKGGCRLTFTFPVVKLLGYKSEEELEADPSPLAVASLVQLGKLRAGSDMGRRLAIKLALARALYVRGYDRERLLKLFRFLDYVLTLPEELSRQFDRELEDIEETLNMPYVTEYRTARRRAPGGRQEGRQEGSRREFSRVSRRGCSRACGTCCSRRCRCGSARRPSRCCGRSSSARMWRRCAPCISRRSPSHPSMNYSSDRASRRPRLNRVPVATLAAAWGGGAQVSRGCQGLISLEGNVTA